MRAQRILTMDLPVLALTDPVSRALTVMDECKVMHLPVVEEDVFKGTVSEAELLEMDELALIAEARLDQESIGMDLHLYDVVARMGWSDVDVLPVPGGGFSARVGERLVIEEVVPPAATTLAVVVDEVGVPQPAALDCAPRPSERA